MVSNIQSLQCTMYSIPVLNESIHAYLSIFKLLFYIFDDCLTVKTDEGSSH